jgi:hypothetical protein
MAVEAKPLYTGTLAAGVHDVYECPDGKTADVVVVHLKNKGSQAAIGMSVIRDGDDIEIFPDGEQAAPGMVTRDINLKLLLDAGSKLRITVGTGGLFQCYLGGFEQTL